MWYCCSCLLLVLSVCVAAAAEPAPAIAPFSSTQAKTHQRAWAKHGGLSVQVTNSVGMKLLLIPPGQFAMGSPPKEEWHRDDEILHRVTLAKAFYMAATEVTQGQWKALMGKNPSFFTGDDPPVETVTWRDAVELCRTYQRNGQLQQRPTKTWQATHAIEKDTT